MYATLAGDVTICSAYSHELPKFGMKAGLTNYAATYATGLLCARRLLTKYGLDETYEGNTENLGDDYHVEAAADERRPFKCFLDTGLVRTSTGSRVRGPQGRCRRRSRHPPQRQALRRLRSPGQVSGPRDPRALHQGCGCRVRGGDAGGGACFPRLVPISPRAGALSFCFVGEGFSRSSAPANEPALTSRPLPSELSQEPEKYEAHFSKYHAEDFDPTELEDAMEGVLDAIREDPTHEKKERKKPADAKSWKPKKLTYDERKANLKAKLEAIVADA